MWTATPIEAILFDLDGLMLDTEVHGLRSWDHAGEDTGLQVPAELRRRMIGRPLRSIHALLRDELPAGAPVDALLERANHHYHRLLESEPPRAKPGLLPLLEHVRDRALPRAVATSSHTEQADRKLRQAGVREYFEHIVGGEQVGRGKPDPDIFLEAARRLGRPAASCLVLEDSGPGVRAAHAAGMRCILVPDLHPPAPEEQRLALAVMDSLDAVLRWLRAGGA